MRNTVGIRVSAIDHEPRSRNLLCHRLHRTTMHVRNYARVSCFRNRETERGRKKERELSFGPAYLSIVNATLVVSIYLLRISSVLQSGFALLRSNLWLTQILITLIMKLEIEIETIYNIRFTVFIYNNN